MKKTVLVIILTVLCIAFAGNSRADWQIDMDVYTYDEQSDTGSAANNLSLGSSTLYTEEFDNKFDTIALLSEPVNAYFYHPEYKSNVQKLWRDFRGVVLPQEWEFEVKASGLNKSINLKWQIQDNDNLHFVLVDKDNGKEMDMSSLSEYSYLPESTLPKTFLLKVAKNEDPTSVDNSNISNNNINNSGTSNTGSTGSKGGGCGYIKDINGNKNKGNNSGNNAINMMILLVPLLLPFQQYVRRYAYIVITR